MNLFESDPFTLPDGRVTHFKVECDALHDSDWDALAHLASKFVPRFSRVEGVPRGGMAFAAAMMPYRSTDGGLLIVDDVWVTGLSMERHRAGRPAHGLVAFARAYTFPWVSALFQMNPLAERATYQETVPL